MVGSADDLRSESGARNSALHDANSMAQRSTGVNAPVRVDSWCVTTSQKRRKVRYSARVLGFVSNEAVEQARAHAAAQAQLEAEREAARLEAEREQARLDAEAKQARLEAWSEQARLEAEREAARREEAAKRGPVDGPDPEPTPDDFEPTPDDFEPTPDDFEPPPSSPTGKRDVEKILAAVKAEAMSTDKLSALALAAKNAVLTAAEARMVLDEIAMSSDKLEALKILRDKIEDPDNWHVLVDAFAFSGDREAARALAP